jgi:hypothetical protein
MTDSRTSPEQRDRKMPAATSIDDRWLLGSASRSASGPASAVGGAPGVPGPAGGPGATPGAVASGSGSTSTRACSPVSHGAGGWLATPGDSAVRPKTSSTTGSSLVAASGSYQPGTGLGSDAAGGRRTRPDAN